MRLRHVFRFVLLAVVAAGPCLEASADPAAEDPHLSFHSVNRWMRTTSDLDKSDDIRAFTSEALFAQSAARLNRPLTTEELRALVRVKQAAQTIDYLRLRPDRNWAVDFRFKYNDIADAQVTQFFDPTRFNRVVVREYGVALQRGFESDSLSGLLRATYNQQDRKGLIEFLPEAWDSVKEYEINGFVATTLSGEPLSAFATYVHQDIDLKIPNPYARSREIAALATAIGGESDWGGADGQALVASSERVFERRFDARGRKLLAGVLYDSEAFGGTRVRKRDVFLATTACAWMERDACGRSLGGIDLGLDFNHFSAQNSSDDSQRNSQTRVGLSAFYQLNESSVVIVSAARDRATTGPGSFENWRAGPELRFRRNHKSAASVSVDFWGSVRYERQRYTALDKSVDLLSALVGVRF